MELSQKQIEFNVAMKQYASRRFYTQFGIFVSTVNVALQGYLITRLWHYPTGFIWLLFSLIVAYLVTDFINGLVHMYMDGNDSYDSIWGPLIANFHLHHKFPQYKKCNLILVYFNETGSKVWLIGYLLAVALLANVPWVEPAAIHFLVYIGIFSSLAEVAHYLCHSSNSSMAKLLANAGILLSKRHHALHHLQDNTNYAFLNGVTDPLLNLIAAKLYKGYKLNTDLHFANYLVEESEKRVL